MEKVYFGSKEEDCTSFSQSKDLLVLRTWSGKSLEATQIAQGTTTPVDGYERVFSHPDRGIEVYRVPEVGLPIEGRPSLSEKGATLEACLSALRASANIRFAGHVLIDDAARAPVIYTENLYIKFGDSLDDQSCKAIVEEHGLIVHRSLPYATNAYFLKMPEGAGKRVFSAALALLKREDVEGCHPEILREKVACAIDSRQWHLKDTTVKRSALTLPTTKVDRAHRTTRGKDVIIAVIDGGFDIDHPDFEDAPDATVKKIVRPVSNPKGDHFNLDPRPRNASEGHGTSVAGIACANGRYYASGVAPEARLMPIRNPEMLGSLLEGDAVHWAMNNGADVICCAWAAPREQWFKPRRLKHVWPPAMPSMPFSTRHAIDFAIRRGRQSKGCIVLFAAGNGNQLITPNSYPGDSNVLAVAASDGWPARAPYSNFGEAVFCAFPSDSGRYTYLRGIWTTKDAPGAYGRPEERTKLTAANISDFYDDGFCGTSAACAGAAGVAALVLSVNADLSRHQVIDIMRRCCQKGYRPSFGDDIPVDAPASRAWYGHGLLDAERAVELASGRGVSIAASDDIAAPALEAVYFGKKDEAAFYYEESPALLAVRTFSGAQLSEQATGCEDGAQLAGIPVVMADASVGLTVYSVDEARLPTLKASLRLLPDVRFAGSVMVAQGTTQPAIYTENIFIKFLDALDETACVAIFEQANVKVKRKVPYASNAYFVAVEEGSGKRVFAVARDLLARDEVEYAHPEIVHPLMLNTIHPNQWHLMHTTVNYTDEIKNSANVEAAHRVSTGRGAVIAVIDDGVDIEHPDFTEPGKIVRPGGVARMHDARPKGRSQSHGTAVAGVACAPGKYHACGVAPDAKLMPFRLWFLFSGASPGSIDSADAIYAAANSQADVINCSWGMAGGDWRDRDDPAHQRKLPLPANLKLAIRYAATKGRNGKGCIVVFAAGNNNVNCDRDTFASNEYVLAVAACDDRGRRSRYSCFGKSVFCAFPSSNMRDPNEWEAKPRTAGIWTTTLSPNTLPFPGQAHVPFTPENVERYYTDSFGGTSSAAPGVAGVVALIVSANPALRREQVMDIIRRTCDKIGDPAVEGQLARYDANGHSHAYGYGRVNAERAVLLAQRSRTAWVERGGPIAIAELGEST